jgi:hypothetical protein
LPNFGAISKNKEHVTNFESFSDRDSGVEAKTLKNHRGTCEYCTVLSVIFPDKSGIDVPCPRSPPKQFSSSEGLYFPFLALKYFFK